MSGRTEGRDVCQRMRQRTLNHSVRRRSRPPKSNVSRYDRRRCVHGPPPHSRIRTITRSILVTVSWPPFAASPSISLASRPKYVLASSFAILRR
jgi:hypothetical protein